MVDNKFFVIFIAKLLNLCSKLHKRAVIHILLTKQYFVTVSLTHLFNLIYETAIYQLSVCNTYFLTHTHNRLKQAEDLPPRYPDTSHQSYAHQLFQTAHLLLLRHFQHYPFCCTCFRDHRFQ